MEMEIAETKPSAGGVRCECAAQYLGHLFLFWMKCSRK
jgi:hypothetical protein